MNYIAIFATSNREFFETLQNKERERNSLVSQSFTLSDYIFCFLLVISRLHSPPLLLFGSKRKNDYFSNVFKPFVQKY